MIHWVTFRNFKALRDVTLRLNQQLTVIVGPNAAGKSSILEGIHYLSQLIRKRSNELFQGDLAPEFLYRSGATKSMELFFKSNQNGLLFEAVPPSDSYAIANAENTANHGWSFKVSAETSSDPLQPLDGLREPSKSYLDRYSSAVFLRLEASHLAQPSYSNRPIPRVEYNGKGLASVLGFLKLEHADHFAQILDGVRSVVSSIRDIHIARAKVLRTETQIITVNNKNTSVRTPREFWGEKLLIDTASGTRIPAHLISEGTLTRIIHGLLG